MSKQKSTLNKHDICDINHNINYGSDNFESAKEIGTDLTYKHEIKWFNVIPITLVHLLAIWGVAVLVTGGVRLKTIAWGCTIFFISGQGIAVGGHRYYSHRSFKATPLLRAILILAHTVAATLPMYRWCLVHRQHHRYSDTDGDRHNATRGFFFSQIGWLLVKGHPYARQLRRSIDMSDLEADWMVMFQKKYYVYFVFIFSILLPVWVPVRFFGESLLNSFLVCFAVRYALFLHFTNFPNSFGHLYGTRPYNKKLQSVESCFVSLVTYGEGWHNYHHTFPWDYKAAELFDFNISAKTIQLCEKLGLAYDLKTATPEQIQNRILQSGDGTHYILGDDEARARVTAIGPLHPLNPSYNVTYPPPSSATIKRKVDL